MVPAMPSTSAPPDLHRVRRALGSALPFALILSQMGCYRVPEGKSAVSDVVIEGAPGVDHDDLEGRIATRKSPRFLALFPGFVYDYELFDRYALRRDLARVERTMRARGYYDAKVHVARVVQDGNKVTVTIEVEEGPPTLVESVAFAGADPLDAETRARIASAARDVLPKGAVFDEDKLEEAEAKVLRALTARGHAAAKVERHVEVDLASSRARLRFDLTPGPIAKIGPVRFEGTGELPESKLRKIFRVEEGDRYSSDDIDEGRQAMLDLGVLATAEITPDLSRLEQDGVVPLTVKCEPAKLRTLLIGGGFEFDSLKTDMHGTIGWQTSNFFGGLRRFDIRWKPGVVFYPTRFPDVEPPTDLLYEQKVGATLKQPALFESRTTGLARADYNLYPVLLPGAPGANVLGYHELRGSVGLERTFFTKLFASPTYGLQINLPFDYIGKTEGVETLVISYIDLLTELDYRDDPAHTKKGFYLGNRLQLAGGLLQGDAQDIRIQPELRGYVSLSKSVVFAMRGSVGFLFPRDYGKYSQINFASPGPSRVEGSARDYQILYFRGFYAGGPSSNRGYPLRGIGPYDLIPYLSPAGQSLTAGSCNPNDVSCSLPTGGLSLWEANAELRVVVSGPFSTAFFCDAADVSPFSFDIRLDRPHLSCGTGARYDTPVGPIRLDVGVRVPGAQYPRGASFERPPDELFGLPIALAFGIGEAF